MRNTIVLALVSFFSLTGFAQQSSEEQWESMFNGKDLSKWKPKIRNHAAGDNFANTLECFGELECDERIIQVIKEEKDTKVKGKEAPLKKIVD